MPRFRHVVLVSLFCLIGASTMAHAWGDPHPPITRAALAVLPEADRWKATLGADNWNLMTRYAMIPDGTRDDWGSYFPEDYWVIPGFPPYVGHSYETAPQYVKIYSHGKDAYAAYFRRCLQAVRTESPTNAARFIGALLHLVEDTGAPPHACGTAEYDRYHYKLENWVNPKTITLEGYQPVLWGKTDDEACQAMLVRMKALNEYTVERAQRALPIVQKGTPDRTDETGRAEAEPLIQECAMESARTAADFLYTLFTLSTTPQPEGAGLDGTVTSALIPAHAEKGALIVLLDDAQYTKLAAQTATSQRDCATPYYTYALTTTPQPNDAVWQGTFTFRHLPAGTYRVLASRMGAQWLISEPVTLETGKVAKLEMTLSPTNPPGNLVQNPTATLSFMHANLPHRWYRIAQGPPATWHSAYLLLKPDTIYRFGAVLKDPTASISIVQVNAALKAERTETLTPNERQPAEIRITATKALPRAMVVIKTKLPLPEAIDRVWLVPEPAE